MKLIPITEARKEHYFGKVYDLTVEDTHSYNINGIAVHNSVCETKTETGVYVPMVTSILECVEERFYVANLNSQKRIDFSPATSLSLQHLEEKKLPLIIADGGIRTPSDMCKALALGADLVMCGSIFAGTKEAPGDTLKVDGKMYKTYRGAASYSVQQENNPDKDIMYNEGNETLVEYKHGGVEKVIKRFKAGLQSSMSYLNARNLNEYRNNVTFIKC